MYVQRENGTVIKDKNICINNIWLTYCFVEAANSQLGSYPPGSDGTIHLQLVSIVGGRTDDDDFTNNSLTNFKS